MVVRLRQVVLTCAGLDPARAALRELVRCGAGDVDPAMAQFGLTHEVLQVGRGTYVEICAPLDADADTTATRFLRRGGDGGYMAVIEVDSAEVLRSRVRELGLRVALAERHQGNELTQLHPREFGTLLEADEICTGSDWHYPAIETAADTTVTAGIVGVDVAVDDPGEMAVRWAAAFDQAVAGDGRSVAFDGGGTARFVPRGEGRGGVVAVDVAATDRSRAGTDHAIGGVTFRFV